MAVLALPLAGAIGASALGLGWQAGWLVGGIAANLFFGPRTPDREGPRLFDQLVSSSAEGAPIAIAYGALRLSGNMIWSGGIRETANERGGGGKGMGIGGGGGSVTEYSYTASFAMAFAEGVAKRPLRIWADGKLILDRTGESPDVSIEGLKLRFYRGTETQLPDPLIAAEEGAARTPAFRGLCYLVLEGLPLADYGNRLPQITAEIAFRDLPALRADLLDVIEAGEGGLFEEVGDADLGLLNNVLSVDWDRQRGYFVSRSASDDDPQTGGLRRFDLRSMAETRQSAYPDLLVETAWADAAIVCVHAGADGFVYLSIADGTRGPLVKVSGETLGEVARFGAGGSGSENLETGFLAASYLLQVPVFGLTGRDDFLVAVTGARVGVLLVEEMAYAGGAGVALAGTALALLLREVGAAETSLWTPALVSGQLVMQRVVISPNGLGAVETVDTVPASAVNPAALNFSGPGNFVRDEQDGGILFLAATTGPAEGADGDFIAKWREGDGILWATSTDEYAFPRSRHVTGQDRLRDGVFTFIAGNLSVEIDTATGEILGEEEWALGAAYTGVYDSRSDTMVHSVLPLVEPFTPRAIRRRYFNRATGEGNTAGEIVADLCARCGLEAEDLDVTELTDSVSGYVVGRQSAARAAIEPLAAAYFFDGVESDDRLAFRKRGREPAAALDAALLVRLDDGAVWRTTRAQEVEIPARVSVIAMNRNQGYRQLAQTAKRAAAPLAAMESREQLTLELPIALRPRQAKRIAESMLWAAWAGRDAYEGRLPRDWLRLEPTDVVTLTLPTGASFRARITRADLGADLTLSLSAVSEEPATYVSEVEAGEGEGYSETPIPGPAAARLFLPQIPLLRDEDSAPAGASRLYFAAAGYAEGWPGATIFRAPDAVAWERIGLARSGPGVGALAAALPAPASPWTYDRANALELFLDLGPEPESVTEAQLLAGANPALVFRPSGEAEILQYRDAEETGPGRWRLSTLLRGRRGTEVFAAEPHAAGAPVLLIGGGVLGATVAAAEIDALRYWRAVGRGADFDAAETVTRAHRGHDLRPYAPVHLAGALDGSDILLSWVRRTRLNGGLRGGTGIVPLQEAAEAYEVDILDGPGGAVLRTLEATTPGATYAAAAIAADFGSTPSALSVAIHQISAEAGRGFAALATLEIA